MKKTTYLFIIVLLALAVCSNVGEYKMISKTDANGFTYATIVNDPFAGRIYTLENGLIVYLTVNKQEPRVQTYIAVRAGGKNDPKETTGLAHYFEHLMVKGTTRFGTKDYAAEKPLLDQIERLYEIHRNTTDAAQRKIIYKEIDRISQEASKVAIPNEYDKLMRAIGSRGTQSWTSYDATMYLEDIPSNQIEAWAMVEANRFSDPVFRLFHTELETIYEEKNMALMQDDYKSSNAILNGLFPHHPYGTQTVLGIPEHLKNPSIADIKKYWETYYVANNMVIVLSGDFDPDKTIAILDKHFGTLRSGGVPAVQVEPEAPITEPVTKEVWGDDAENVLIAFRLPAANSRDMEIAQVVNYLMSNGKAGLIDLNLNQRQLVLGAGNHIYGMADYGAFILNGRPKQEQTLDDVKDLLLEQVDLLKLGKFEDWLIEATVNNFRLQRIQDFQTNLSRVRTVASVFINNENWLDAVSRLSRQAKITKQDVIDFANKYFADNYVVVYKRQGKDQNVKKVEKPQITPISANYDGNSESEFLKHVKAIQVEPIEPLFLDFNKDITKLTTKTHIPLLYERNTENGLFELTYLCDMGNDSDKALSLAFLYLEYVGTSQYTPEQIKSEFYKIACTYNFQASNNRVTITLRGLDDNFERAVELFELLLNDLQVDQTAFYNLLLDFNQFRDNEKLNRQRLLTALRSYGIWGPKSSITNVLTADEMAQLKPEDLIARILDMKNFKHRILYYGPRSASKINSFISKMHTVGSKLKEVLPPPVFFKQQETPTNKVYFVHYNSPQVFINMISKGEKYDKSIGPIRMMYNRYFGEGRNAIVFQEMRETRNVAYGAGASYVVDWSNPDLSYIHWAAIFTHGDKITDAVSTFHELINDMPESEKAFNLAKESAITNLRTERIVRGTVLWEYLNAEKFGYTHDLRKDRFEKYQTMTLDDVKAFHEKYITGRNYFYCILGDEKDSKLMREIAKLGEVQKLSVEEIFGY